MTPQGLSPSEMVAAALCLLVAAVAGWALLADALAMLGLGRWRVDRLPLRQVCAWCGAQISAGRGPASHGICRGCQAKYFPHTERAA